ncbi:RDD family protein [Streptomyces tritici]|uniref:RDD family protein n=1 Tax=Streptomyces tritici TaxID=2054410 RepID=UPI003AEFF872
MSFGDPNDPYNQQPPQGQPPYGYPQQAPQGVPPQYGYPQQPAQPYGAAYPPVIGGFPELAHWGLRVGAYMLDGLIIAGPMYALGFTELALNGSDEPGPIFAVGVVYALCMAFFQLYREGRTGQSTGKKVMGISLLRERDGSPLGFGMAFVRKIAHIVDSLACYLGWLWPLWDEKKQTFADKICGTVVVRANRG